MAAYVKRNTAISCVAHVQMYFDLTPIDLNCSMKHIFHSFLSLLRKTPILEVETIAECRQ